MKRYRPFKGRKYDHKRPVRVYRNLGRNDNGRYSIKQDGLVVAHANEVYVNHAKMIVSEATRQRVIRENKKYVHAFIEGYIVELMGLHPNRNPLAYNPFKRGAFFNPQTDKEVNEAWLVRLTEKGVWYHV